MWLVKRRYKPSEDKTPFERITEGQRIDYNFVKPHMGLEGKTPADASGIKLEGDNNAGWHYFGMRERVTLNEDKNLRHEEGSLISSSENVIFSGRISSSFGLSRFSRKSDRLDFRL